MRHRWIQTACLLILVPCQLISQVSVESNPTSTSSNQQFEEQALANEVFSCRYHRPVSIAMIPILVLLSSVQPAYSQHKSRNPKIQMPAAPKNAAQLGQDLRDSLADSGSPKNINKGATPEEFSNLQRAVADLIFREGGVEQLADIVKGLQNKSLLAKPKLVNYIKAVWREISQELGPNHSLISNTAAWASVRIRVSLVNASYSKNVNKPPTSAELDDFRKAVLELINLKGGIERLMALVADLKGTISRDYKPSLIQPLILIIMRAIAHAPVPESVVVPKGFMEAADRLLKEAVAASLERGHRSIRVPVFNPDNPVPKVEVPDKDDQNWYDTYYRTLYLILDLGFNAKFLPPNTAKLLLEARALFLAPGIRFSNDLADACLWASGRIERLTAEVKFEPKAANKAEKEPEIINILLGEPSKVRSEALQKHALKVRNAQGVPTEQGEVSQWVNQSQRVRDALIKRFEVDLQSEDALTSAGAALILTQFSLDQKQLTHLLDTVTHRRYDPALTDHQTTDLFDYTLDVIAKLASRPDSKVYFEVYRNILIQVINGQGGFQNDLSQNRAVHELLKRLPPEKAIPGIGGPLVGLITRHIRNSDMPYDEILSIVYKGEQIFLPEARKQDLKNALKALRKDNKAFNRNEDFKKKRVGNIQNLIDKSAIWKKNVASLEVLSTQSLSAFALPLEILLSPKIAREYLQYKALAIVNKFFEGQKLVPTKAPFEDLNWNPDKLIAIAA